MWVHADSSGRWLGIQFIRVNAAIEAILQYLIGLRVDAFGGAKEDQGETRVFSNGLLQIL